MRSSYFKNRDSYWNTTYNSNPYSLNESYFQDSKVEYLIESINSDINSNRYSLLLEEEDKGFFSLLGDMKDWFSKKISDGNETVKEWVRGDPNKFNAATTKVKNLRNNYESQLKILEDAYAKAKDEKLKSKYGEYLDWVKTGKLDPSRLFAGDFISPSKKKEDFFDDKGVIKEDNISGYRKAQDEQTKSAGLSGKVQLMGQWMQDNPGYTAAGLGAAGLIGIYYLYRKWKKKKEISKEDAENAEKLQRRFQQQ